MMLVVLLTAAHATPMADPWDCPAPASLEEMRAITFADPDQVWDLAWEEASAWIDASCVSDCMASSGSFNEACSQASCVSGSGAELEYLEGTGSLGYTWYTEKRLVVRLPAGTGGTWTAVDLASFSEDTYDDIYRVTSSSAEWTAAWEGTLVAGWPADEAVSASRRSSSGSMGSGGGTTTFAGTGCSWSTYSASAYDMDECSIGYGSSWRREINGTTGSVRWEVCGACVDAGRYIGTWNGVRVGEVDSLTWEAAGSVDLDGDTYFADHDDCDDTDPTVHPCADDVWYDGFDADCRGDDDADQDGDGHGAVEVGGDDCDDLDRRVHPSAEEEPCDGVDQDCNGEDWCDPDTGDTATTDTGETGDTAAASPRPERPDEPRRAGRGGCGAGAALLLALLPLARKRSRS